jgi:hypothetical protein
LTDIEPLHGFNPATGDQKSPGQSVVKEDFLNTTFDATPLNTIQQPQRQGGRQADEPQAKPSINAVRISGFWRENPRGQNVVSELLRELRERTDIFSLTTTDGRGNEVPLDEKEIITQLSVTGGDGELAYRFRIVLPLAHEIAIK